MTKIQFDDLSLNNPESLFTAIAREIIKKNNSDADEENNIYRLMFHLKSLNPEHYEILHKAYTSFSTISFLNTDIEMKIKAPQMENESAKIKETCLKYMTELKKTLRNSEKEIIESCNKLMEMI